ncbi:S8 family peptidase [Bacillus halotolerans]|uniref:S8 family peptidase n=1 Tax=Bacillus halotolerans TaxID=260554 RepID=UPI001E5C49BD|nr:S8 family serine peptidase [Bacillus halotolerans]
METIELIQNADLYKKWGWSVDLITGSGKTFRSEQGSQDVKIAIIDSGIDVNHPDLKDNIILEQAISFVDDSINDKIGHGTQIAGIIAAKGRLLGIGPNLKLIPYKVMRDNTSSASFVLQALYKAYDEKVDIINLSLGAYNALKNQKDLIEIREYNKIVEKLLDRNTFIVSSIGNDQRKICRYNQEFANDDLYILPTSLDGVIGVASVKKNMSLADYSNYGDCITICGYGGELGDSWNKNRFFDIRQMVLTTLPLGKEPSIIGKALDLPRGYDLTYGTSIATAQVTATIGLILSKFKRNKKSYEYEDVLEVLLKGAVSNCHKFKEVNESEARIVNAYNSLMFMDDYQY